MLGVKDLHESQIPILLANGSERVYNRGVGPLGLLQKLATSYRHAEGGMLGRPHPHQLKNMTSNGRWADSSTFEVGATSGRRP